MKIVLEGPAIKEIFDQYATPAMRDEVRKKIQAEMDDIIKNEIKKKTDNYVTTNKIESALRNSLSSQISSYRNNLPNDEMKNIVMEEFKRKVSDINFEKLEETMLEEAREMIEIKCKKYRALLKHIVENQI